MKLGAFSVSLNVKDIHKSKEFYENIGFEAFAGEIEPVWLILRNDNSVIGIFQGMFEKNMMTYNPGWNQDCSPQEEFTDIRDIKKHLEGKGIEVVNPAMEGDSGPGNLSITDPDGNIILLDQHV